VESASHTTICSCCDVTSVIAAAGDKRLDKWVPWTRVQKFTGELNKETLSSLKSLTVDPITPSKVGLGTSNTAGTPTRPLTRKLRRQLFGINVIPKVCTTCAEKFKFLLSQYWTTGSPVLAHSGK
jgi:hypothetical protein